MSQKSKAQAEAIVERLESAFAVSCKIVKLTRRDLCIEAGVRPLVAVSYSWNAIGGYWIYDGAGLNFAAVSEAANSATNEARKE